MARSLKKGFYTDPKIMKKITNFSSTGEKKIIRIWNRSCTILPEMIGITFAVHNGKTFQTLYVTEDMLGHKFGEFAITRVFKGHPF